MISVKVLFFATFKDKAGTSWMDLALNDGDRVADFKRTLLDQIPALGELIDRSLIAVNENYAFDEDAIPDGAEVAVFPPVSGGQPRQTLLKVTPDSLNLDQLVAQITYPTTGAACIFTGMVRGQTERGQPHQTAALEYEAYQAMAEVKMAQVAEEIRQRWPSVEGIVIVQRIGKLAAGTPTVLIACSAAHRDTGVFEAARYGIDRLKEIVPVWKREIGPSGEVWVEGDYHPQRGD